MFDVCLLDLHSMFPFVCLEGSINVLVQWRLASILLSFRGEMPPNSPRHDLDRFVINNQQILRLENPKVF